MQVAGVLQMLIGLLALIMMSIRSWQSTINETRQINIVEMIKLIEVIKLLMQRTVAIRLTGNGQADLVPRRIDH